MRKSKGTRITRASVMALCSAAVVVFARSTVQAQDIDPTAPSRQIELGILGDTQKSPKFGDYTGLKDDGAYAIGSFDLRGGNSESADRWRLTARNLGLDSRDVFGEFREQGRFRIHVRYDELLHYRTNTYQTPFLGAGTASLTLPSSWTRSNTTVPLAPPQTAATLAVSPGMTQLTASLHDFLADTKRKKYDSGIDLNLGSHWTAGISFSHENKDGTKLIGAAIGGLRGMLLPDPVSTATNQVEAKLAVAGTRGRLEAGYCASLFTNDITTFTFQNPFVGGLSSGQMSSPPDNQFHQWVAHGTYKLSKTARLVGSLVYSRSTQNESFASPFFGATAAQISAGMPAASLDGLVVTKTANLRMTTKPVKDLSVTAAYKYDDRDNQTPQNTYLVPTSPDNPGPFVPANAGSTYPVPLNTVSARINPVGRRTTNLFDLDADYALTDTMALKAGYDFQQIKRTESENDNVTENTARIEYRLHVSDTVTGRVGYSYAARRGDYQQYAAYLSTQTPAYVATTGWAGAGLTPFGTDGPFTTSGYVGPLSGTDLLGLRRFFLADRNRDKVRSSLTLLPTEALSIQGGLDYNRDAYDNSLFGLKESKNWAPFVNVTYAVSKNVAASAFYTYEDIRSVQDDRSWTGASAAVPLGKTDPQRNWSADIADKVSTVGADLEAHSGKLQVNGDLLYSHGRTLIGVAGNSTATVLGVANTFVAAQPLPDVASDSTTASLSGRYDVSSSVSVRAGYVYWHLNSSDYALDGVGPTTLQSYIGPNESSPNYRVHVISLSCLYRF